jgi:hypothetical protein
MPPSSVLRLLLISVVVPAGVVAADSIALPAANSQFWSTQATLVVFALFLVQVSVLSYLAGHYLPNWPWRLLVLGWSAAVIDLLLYTVSVVAPYRWSNAGASLLVFAFFGSQICLGLIWAILGAAVWRWRLPASALALAPAVYFVFRVSSEQYSANMWLGVVFVQTLGVLGLAGLLRAFGYRIAPFADVAPSAGGGPLQFSIKHMLIWTTVSAVIVMVTKQIALSSPHLDWLQTFIDGVVLALVALSAMWLALGSGRAWLTALVALSLAGAAGIALWYVGEQFIALRNSARRFYWMPHAGWWWMGWTLLANPFLAGLLLVFRTTGHRLVRRRRTSQPDAVSPWS